MRHIIVCLLVVFIPFSALAQEGYSINFKIKGFKDSVAYLGYYYWESTFIADTTQVSRDGSFSFKGSKNLSQGVYMLVTKTKAGNALLFDFVVGKDQHFTLETDSENYTQSMKVNGDVDNTLYFENLANYMKRGKEAEPFVKILRDSSLSVLTKHEARENFNSISKKVLDYQESIIKHNPTTVTAKLIKSNKSIEIPDPPVLPNGKVDSTFQFRYYKNHYWDNFDLADEVLIRLPKPLYLEKLKFFLEKFVGPNPDSLSKEIDKLATIARKNKETYKYLVWKCMAEYSNSKIMGLDAVYVHLFDRYFASKEMDYWINEKTKKNIRDYADQLRRSLIGQTAPNLIMQDQNLQPRNMYDLNKRYTILFIFDPDCPTCRAETPELISFYNAHKKKFDLEVYAVCMDSSLKTMRKFIQEMNTPWVTVNGPRSYVGSIATLYDASHVPSLYIIDEKKKIIAKKPPIDQIYNFLNHYEMASGKKSRP
jgi:peroxiredoxin